MTGVIPRRVTEPSAGVGGSGYRPHLDGLRALAVYLVVLFHAGVDRASGGFIGVDVFFVLSGYLVTQMLLRDITGPEGLRYGRFYARRVRRLLPASLAALLVTAIVYSAVAGPGEAAAARSSFQASFLYVANWFFIHHSTDYFGSVAETNPVLHVWSLAVEEQFYLVWPVLLGGAFWLARQARIRRRMLAVRSLVTAGAGASLVWALVLQRSDFARGYYGTDARAYQLLAGAALALTPGAIGRLRRRWPTTPLPRVASVGALLALGFLATSVLTVGPITRGAAATVVTLVALVSLEWQPRGLAHRVLASEPVAYLGRISYGTYLWHWPVIVIAIQLADPTPASLTAISALIATGLAALSYQLLELPIRRPSVLDRRRLPVIAVGLAASVGFGAVVIPDVLAEPASPAVVVSTTAGFTPIPEEIDPETLFLEKYGTTVACREREPEACTLVRGNGPDILLMGDSNAAALIPTFVAAAEAGDFTLSVAVTDGCPWQRHLNYFAEWAPHCELNREDAYERLLPAFGPDIVVLVDTELPEARVTMEELRETSTASVDQLRAPGRTLLLVNPVLHAPADQRPLPCLADNRFLEDCRFVADVTPSRTDRLHEELAADKPDIRVVDLDPVVCPYLPICDPVIDGLVVRWDMQHLSTRYAASLGDEMIAILRNLELLPD